MANLTMDLKEWMRYRDILRSLSQRAADEFRDAVWKTGGRWNAAGLGNIPRDDLIDFAYALVTKYGEGAASIACELYDQIAELSGVAVPPAIPAATASRADVAIALNGTLENSVNDDLVSGAVGRLVKLAGQDTTMRNAIRDGAQVAWIPSGDTCPFCLMLASRGWEYASKKMVKKGHAAHIHAHCDCAYGVRFSESFQVKGYDPDKYLRTYQNAEGATWQEKINTMRRENYAEHSAEINAQKRAAYKLRKEAEEILEDEGK